MVLFNYSTRELTAKIVYYGPGLCGKTTNLQFIHSTLPDNVKGKMLSLATKTDRTLFFDFLPIDLGNIRGMKTRVQLYTVPGQVFYNETRKLVLKGADGIVFVADSQSTMLGANVESFKNLEDNLRTHGMNLSEMPHVLQFNKRDLPKLAGIEELNSAINRFNAPFYESVATTGIGVQDTLKAITKLVLLQLTRKYDPKTTAAAVQAHAPSVSVGAPARAVAPPSRPTPPAPSPAQTMQMPVAGTPSSRSIPLSDAPSFGDPAHGIPATPTVPASEKAIDRQALTPFEDTEIQDLVDEVQAVDEEVYDLGGDGPAAGSVDETDEAAQQLVESIEPWADQAPPSAAEAGALEAQTPDAARPGETSATPAAFEIDHGLDPDWGSAAQDVTDVPLPSHAETVRGSDGDSPAADPERAWELGGVEDAAAKTRAAFDEEHTDDKSALPRLTEVVEDRELFDDPAIDVARMVAGEEREIVIPLEVEDAARTLQRFKLSIRLRMDPLD